MTIRNGKVEAEMHYVMYLKITVGFHLKNDAFVVNSINYCVRIT